MYKIFITISLLGTWLSAYSQFPEPTNPDITIIIRILDLNEMGNTQETPGGRIFHLINRNWECNSINLGHVYKGKKPHSSKEISKTEFDSRTSDANNIITNLSDIIARDSSINQCGFAQDYLRSGHVFLWIKEGDKYMEYEVYPSVGGAYIEE